MPHKIIIAPTKRSAGRGQLYGVHYDGNVLIADTRNPEFDACRRLLSLGITGMLETWRPDQPDPSMRMDIAKAAKLSMIDNGRDGPRFAKWAPIAEGAFGNAVSRRSGSPRTGKRDFQVSSWPAGDEGHFSAPPSAELAPPDLERVEA